MDNSSGLVIPLKSPTGGQKYHPSIRRIEIINLEAYHLISALKDHVKSYVTAGSLVPVLGAETITARSSHDTNLIRHLKQLAWRNVENENIFMDFDNIKPFLDVLKSFDVKQDHIVILCIEALSKMANCETVRIDDDHAPAVLNKTFEGILSVFTNNIEPKEDLITLKILLLLGDILTCKGGDLITNDNVVKMFKIIVTTLTARHRNSAIRKLIHDAVVNLLQYSLGHVSNRNKVHVSNHLFERRSSAYLFISLLISHSLDDVTFNLHHEDLYLALKDKDALRMFRAEFADLVQNISSIPTMWNEFCDDICTIGLRGFNQCVELAKFDHTKCPRIVPIIQAHLTNSIYRMCFTESLSKYSLVLRSLRNLYSYFRISLKAQLEVYLTHIIGSVINYIYPNKGNPLKPDITEMNMEFLLELCQNPEFLMEVYVNYDCDVISNSLFDLLLKGLVSCIYPVQDVPDTTTTTTTTTTTSSTATATSSAATPNPLQIRGRKPQTNYAIKRRGTATSAFKAAYSTPNQSPGVCLEPMAICAIQDILRFIFYNENEEGESTAHSPVRCLPVDQRKIKMKLQQGAEIFNNSKSDDSWIEGVKEIGLLPLEYTAKDVALFLKHVPGLNLRKLGEFLGTHKNVEFMDKVRKEFTLLHSFGGLPIVSAIRLFLSSFRLPGESQQIERLVEVFAVTYFESQPLVEEYAQDKSLKPRWIIQENYFSKPRFSTFNVLANHKDAETATHISITESNGESAEIDFERYFGNETLEHLNKERFNCMVELLKETPSTKGIVADPPSERSVESEEELKTAALKASSNVATICKNGFACVENSDAIFVLAYSIIMLNTDLHNTQIKRKMKLEDFVRNNKTINNGKDLPFEFLEDIYQSIKNHEIKLHQGGEQKDLGGYNPFYWVDHVLVHQQVCGRFDTSVKLSNYTLKCEMFHLLCQNDIVKALDNAYATAETVYELKQCIRVFWLLVSVAVKFSMPKVVNSIVHLGSITTTDALTYRCQLSISLLVNVLATASRFFDYNSWSKLMCILIKFYSLNLIPMTFAAIDMDPHILVPCKSIQDGLFPPSIRFKRYTDMKKNASWLGGWTNFIPFNRSTLLNDIKEGSETLQDEQEFVMNGEGGGDPNKPNTSLFLFDVQSGAKLIGNDYFDVSLLGSGCNPVATAEDESAIVEVTRAFSNDVDKEELLPQVLAYMNLRLAFLNVYNLDNLVLGASTDVPLETFVVLVKMLMKRIFANATESNKGAPIPEFTFVEGALLDPSPREIAAFQDKVDSIFCLGIFTRFVKRLLEYHNTVEKSNEDNGDPEGESKSAYSLNALLYCLYSLCRKLMVEDAIVHVPTPSMVATRLNLSKEPWTLKPAESLNTLYSSFVCVTILKLVHWFAERSSCIQDDGNEDAQEKTNSSIDKSDVYLTTSAWLLNIVIHFNEQVLSPHLPSLVKVLSNLAGNGNLGCNNYLVMVVLCACQRVVNPLLPFGKNLSVVEAVTGAFKGGSAALSIGAILPILLQRTSCLKGQTSYAVARAIAQTLLSMALFCKPIARSKKNDAEFDEWNDNLIAVQLLIEFRTFASVAQEEYMWLLSVHCLSIVCAVGPLITYLEAIKGLTRLLLQEQFPQAQCSRIQQLVRIFDYVLAPTLTGNFHYPMDHQTIANSLSDDYDGIDYTLKYWDIPNNMGDGHIGDLLVHLDSTWMSHYIYKYVRAYTHDNLEDMSTRKAAITNLICHFMLSQLSILTRSQLEPATPDKIKSKASNLECLLYTSDEEICGQNCIKRFITVTRYMLGVIIPSNGECSTDPSNDTFVESLKNFILVILTCPELKSAPAECAQHFVNDHELKACLTLLKESVDLENTTRGEYVLASLLAHMFSTSEVLKDLFHDILKVVFPRAPESTQ